MLITNSAHSSKSLTEAFADKLPRKMVIAVAIFYSVFTLSPANAEFNAREVSAVEAAEILKDNPAVKVLDVRTGMEYRRGHIQGAVNLNYYSFKFKSNLDKLDKDTTWLVHCHSGVRSGKTLTLMKNAGFNNIVHLSNGIVEWKKAGLPLLK